MSGKTHRILVMSDSHGDVMQLRWLLEQAWKRVGPIETYIHCGDGIRDFEDLDRFIEARDRLPGLIGVRGNCDYGSEEMDTRTFRVGECGILVTHGHRFQVKEGLDMLTWAAKEQGCSVALFGHTHRPFTEERGGVLLLNPGCASGDTLGLLTIGDSGERKAEILYF